MYDDSTPLYEVSWADIEQLIEFGREEDDTIEFKRCFKGGDDYIALNDKGREQSLDAIAREAIAFLNTRGGDIVIGLAEADGAHPRAEELMPIKSPADTAERLARGLSAIIEPAQTNINVRAVASPNDDARGVVIARVQASIRAPHRSRRTLECFARRGSESVPMAMDEIQDTTINRTRLRLEQQDFLDRQFSDFVLGKAEHRHLGDELLHVRSVIVPVLEQTLQITDDVLNALATKDPLYYDEAGRRYQNDVAFRNLNARWLPVLRGMKREDYREHTQLNIKDFQYARKVIKASGVCSFDYAGTSHFQGDDPVIHYGWLVGYFAQLADNIASLARILPSILPATIRVGLRGSGAVHLEYGSDMWPAQKPVPDEVIYFPDFAINSADDLDAFFRQAQMDLFAVVNEDRGSPFTLNAPAAKAQSAQAAE